MSYVYAMTNQMFKDRGVFRPFKIGMTTTDPFTRARELYTTGVPHPFRVVWYHQCVDPRWYEQELHTIFQDKRYNKKREFFYLPHDGIREHLDGLAIELDEKFQAQLDDQSFQDLCAYVGEQSEDTLIAVVKQMCDIDPLFKAELHAHTKQIVAPHG